mgnify:CR=1 FL=1
MRAGVVAEWRVGVRVQDVRRAVEYTVSRPGVSAADLELVGYGEGALWAIYAAALASISTDRLSSLDIGMACSETRANVAYLHFES